MRLLTLIAVAVAALVVAPAALAVIPESGLMIYKESRLQSVVEIRTKGTGRIVYSAKKLPTPTGSSDPCADPAYALSGPRWKEVEPFVVNTASTPSHIGASATLADLRASADAWEPPFTTDCPQPSGKAKKYDARYGGTTSRLASLAASLSADGVNAVAFQSLAGTVCDGATACVVLDYEKRVIREADMALERDLTRYGFQDFWTTDDTTWWDEAGGRWAVADVATHEFGHFAGLGHVDASPALTMFPLVHDGAQTLGLGDMLGVLELY
jgi:Matrixin